MSNETQTLMLGDVDIGEYVQPFPAPTLPNIETIKDERNRISENILKLKKDNPLSFEKFLITDLETKLKEIEDIIKKDASAHELNFAKYPEIDLSFLTKSYDKKVGERKIIGFFDSKKEDVCIKIPAFSVYPFYGEDNKFSIDYQLGYWDETISHKTKFALIINFSNPTPRKIQDFLIKSMTKEFNIFATNYYLHIGGRVNEHWLYLKEKSDFPQNLRYSNGINKTLTSQFNGIIPQKVKEKVEKSKEYFRKDDIFMIAETKPEEWNVEELKRDPLVIGMKDEKAYIISHFNCTPLENLVKDVYAGRGN